jgi:hypothetical protein
VRCSCLPLFRAVYREKALRDFTSPFAKPRSQNAKLAAPIWEIPQWVFGRNTSLFRGGEMCDDGLPQARREFPPQAIALNGRARWAKAQARRLGDRSKGAAARYQAFWLLHLQTRTGRGISASALQCSCPKSTDTRLHGDCASRLHFDCAAAQVPGERLAWPQLGQ